MSQGKSDSLAAAISRRLAASVLPGEEALTAPDLAEAARFVRQTATRRKLGEAAIGDRARRIGRAAYADCRGER